MKHKDSFEMQNIFYPLGPEKKSFSVRYQDLEMYAGFYAYEKVNISFYKSEI